MIVFHSMIIHNSLILFDFHFRMIIILSLFFITNNDNNLCTTKDIIYQIKINQCRMMHSVRVCVFVYGKGRGGLRCVDQFGSLLIAARLQQVSLSP